jgi:hypothetical protein
VFRTARRAAISARLATKRIPARLHARRLRLSFREAFLGAPRLRLAILPLRGLAQVFQFFRLQFTQVAGLEIEHERAVADPPNLLHAMPDLLEHLAQFTVAAFDKNHLKPRVLVSSRTAGLPPIAGFPGVESADLGGGGLDPTGASRAAIDRDSLTQALDIFFRGLAADFDQVRLLHTRCRASQLVGQFAVIGDQQQALAHVIESANRIKPLAHLREKLHDRRPPLGVAHCRDEALGLVQHVIAVAL